MLSENWDGTRKMVSRVNELGNLIQQFCPNGVEYIKIGNVVDYEQPSKYR